MGSFSTLGIENLELIWNKNCLSYHGGLFAKEDLTKEKCAFLNDEQDTIDYEEEEVYAKPLNEVVIRLNLMGYSLQGCRQRFNSLIKECLEHESKHISFNDYQDLIKAIDINKIQENKEALWTEEGFDLGEFARIIFSDQELNGRCKKFGFENKWDFSFFENIDPYITLRLLGENPVNLEKRIIWRFKDVLEGGWSNIEDVHEGVGAKSQFLIITEGSTDTQIIKTALSKLKPDIASFFTFIDMEKNYPFGGASNLYKFCQGLVKINIMNTILVILDNDVTGNQEYQNIAKLPLPHNMRVVRLPELSEFQKVKTVGPNNKHEYLDINGAAVSIECFLDFEYDSNDEAIIRWIQWDQSAKKYQGRLDNKEKLQKKFFDAIKNNGSAYNYQKLSYLTDFIYSECVKLSSRSD
jgi:hypothetical protein